MALWDTVHTALILASHLGLFTFAYCAQYTVHTAYYTNNNSRLCPADILFFLFWRCCLRSVNKPRRDQNASPPPALTSTSRTLSTSKNRTTSLSSARTLNQTTWYALLLLFAISITCRSSNLSFLPALKNLFTSFISKFHICTALCWHICTLYIF